jgi:hypothetical protein
MKSKKNTGKDQVKVSKSGLLSLVASKLKGRVLFPEKIEKMKEYLRQAEIKIS